MNWIPRNRTTDIEYPAIDDATKAQWEADPMLKSKYTYKKTDEPARIVSKKAQAPKKPVGVPGPPTETPETYEQ